MKTGVTVLVQRNWLKFKKEKCVLKGLLRIEKGPTSLRNVKILN